MVITTGKHPKDVTNYKVARKFIEENFMAERFVSPQFSFNPQPRTYTRVEDKIVCTRKGKTLFTLSIEDKLLTIYEKEQFAKQIMDDLYYGEYTGG